MYIGRLREYRPRNFVLPTASVAVANVVTAQIGKKKGHCHCGGKCKGKDKSRSFPPKRAGLGRLGDATDFYSQMASMPDTSNTDIGFQFPNSTIYNTPTFVAAPDSGGLIPGLSSPPVTSSSPGILNFLSNFGAQAGSLAIRNALAPGVSTPKPQTPASSIFGSGPAGTVAGIPTSYFIYGGVGLLAVMLISGGRRR